MRIGELARQTGFPAKTIRYYEERGLLAAPGRTAAGYRQYGEDDVARLRFIDKAKRLGFTLDEIRDILTISEQQAPCVHVLALIDQKLSQLDGALRDLRAFRRDLTRVRRESADRLDRLPDDAAVCGIIERGVHARAEAALAWLEYQRPRPGRAPSKVKPRRRAR